MQRQKKLLIVDERAENRKVLCCALQDKYTVLEAENCDQAFAMLTEETCPDLMVLKLFIRPVEGYGLLRKVRSTPALSGVRVLALVEANSQGSLEQAEIMGADEALEYMPTSIAIQGSVRRIFQGVAGDDRQHEKRGVVWDCLWDTPVSVACFQRVQQESLIWANPTFFALRGAEVDLAPSAMNKIMDSTLHPEDAPRVRRELREAIHNQREECSCWYRIRHGSSEWRTVVGNFSWISAGGGLRFTLTEADCTMLVQQEELLLGMAERLPGAVIVFRRDAQLTTLYTSVDLWRMLHYDVYDRGAGTTTPSGMELMSAGSFARLKEALDGQEAGGEIRLDVRLRRRDGRLMAFLMRGRVVAGPDGELQVYAVLWDVRESRRTQEELVSALNAERESLRYLRTAMQAVLPVAGINLWRYDPERHQIWPMNTEVPALWQIALRDAPESLIRCGLVLEDTAEDCREMFRLLGTHTRNVSRILHMQLQKNHAPQWLSFHFVIADTEEDGTPMVVGISQDVSDKIDAIESYRQERRYREALLEDAMLCFEADLTSRILRRADADFLATLRLDNTADYAQLLRSMASQVVAEANREEFLNRMTPENLIESFRKGTRLVQFDAQMQFHFTNQAIWVASIAHLVQDERTGHIHMTWQLKDANETKRQELWLRDQAKRDSLTGLYNRANFEDIVTECLRQNEAEGAEAAVFMLDVDDFKWINDNLGHDQGDQILRQIGASLRSVFRASDVVARVGGDEFAVLIPQCKNRQRIRERGQQVLDCMRQIKLPGSLSVSLGLAFTPEGGTSFSELYHSADQALYQAKSDGKGKLSVWGDCPKEA